MLSKIDKKLKVIVVMVLSMSFSAIHHISAKRVIEGKVRVIVYRNNEKTPLEKTIYYLK